MEGRSPKENQGIIQKEEFMLACNQKKQRRKNKVKTKVCMYVHYLINLSRVCDIITKTIPGHKRSYQPTSTISNTLLLP